MVYTLAAHRYIDRGLFPGMLIFAGIGHNGIEKGGGKSGDPPENSLPFLKNSQNHPFRSVLRINSVIILFSRIRQNYPLYNALQRCYYIRHCWFPLFNLFPDFIHYIVSFVLLAGFWRASHQRSQYHQSIDHNGFPNYYDPAFRRINPIFSQSCRKFSSEHPCRHNFRIKSISDLAHVGFTMESDYIQHREFWYLCLYQNVVLNLEEAYIFPLLPILAIVLALISVPWGIFYLCCCTGILCDDLVVGFKISSNKTKIFWKRLK